MINEKQINARLKLIFQGFQVDLNEMEVLALQKMLTPVLYKKNDHFVRAGDTHTKFGIVFKGLVRFYLNTNDGKQYNDTFYKENGIILNYFPIMTRQPSPFFVQALEDTILLEGNYEEFDVLCFKSHHWSQISKKLFEINFIKKAERSFDLLLYNVKERLEKFQNRYPGYSERIPKEHLAMYLGIDLKGVHDLFGIKN